MNPGLVNELYELREIWTRYRVAGLEVQLGKAMELVTGAGAVDVAVVGRFKAGKSSLLNHLAGRALLPSGVVPVTAVITRLAFAERESVEVRFSSGESQMIDVGDVAGFVSERGNPHNVKGVVEVDVCTPALRRLGALRLVDTPGLGSALAHNTERAREWFPKLGAAILAVSVDAPLSDEDLKTVTQLKQLTPKVAVVLTKVDLLNDFERHEIVEFVGRKLREHCGELELFEYSVREGFESLRERFERDWLLPLAHNYVETRRQIAEHKVRSLREQLRAFLQVSLAVATEKAEAGGELRIKLAEERRQFSLLQTEIATLAHRYASSAMDEGLKHLDSFAGALTAELVAEFDAKSVGWDLSIPKLIEAYRVWLDETLTARLQMISIRERSALAEPLARTSEHLNRTVRAFQDRLAKEVRASLGMELPVREFESDIETPPAPPISVGRVFDTPLDLLGYLLPASVFGKWVKRRMRRALRLELEKNLSRVAAQWSGRVMKAIEELEGKAEDFAIEELGTLEMATEERRDGVGQLKADIEQINREL